MALETGRTLGPYEIVAPLGAGGMGEVYRARDTRLGRDVAIKVLPQHLASTPEMRARFEREAKTISSLNHPHICTLHDVGRDGDTEYLVMELVEGETLAARLARGPVPPPELLRIGTQIADALDRAHRAGVVHRDLKPANIMLTKSGAKLMDFGLARTTGIVSAAGGSGGMSPTVTKTPTVAQALTTAGTILGTFQYMAPEQLEGGEADTRSDVWALGVVLYEMATGRKAFEGRSQASLIGAIMSVEPPSVVGVAPQAPPALDQLIRACLCKDPEQRIQTAHDVKLQLQWMQEGGSQVGAAVPVAARRRRREGMLLGALAVSVAAAAVLGWLYLRRPETNPQVMRFEIPPPESIQFQDSPRISPDGHFIAYNATDSSGVSRIYVRPLEALTAQLLPGSEGAKRPFWSPDSRYLAFVAGGKLKKVQVSGGPAVVLCDAPTGSDGSWGSGDVILYDGGSNDPIRRVSASGGVPTDAVASTATVQVGWPEFLPDGRHFLYLALGTKPTLRVGTLDSAESKDLGPCDSQLKYISPGYLLYSRGGTLVTQRFDAKKLAFEGDPIPVAEQVTTSAVGASDFDASENGILVYSTRRAQTGKLVQVDREGREVRTIQGPSGMLVPELSPDGRRIAVRVLNDQSRSRDVWLLDPSRDLASRLTFEPGNENYPLWSPDGKRILYYSDAEGGNGLYVKDLTGAGTSQLVLPWKEGEITPSCWSRDGRYVFFDVDAIAGTLTDVWVLSMSGERKASPFLSGPFREGHARLSPDGRYLLYTSDESGENQVYAQSWPDRSDKVQISPRGGFDAEWSDDGKEIFYLSPDQHMMSVPVRTSPSLEPGAPVNLFATHVLFPGTARNHYTVSADGRSFYVLEPEAGPNLPSTTIVINWLAALGRR